MAQKRKKIQFLARKKIAKPTHVSFVTKDGKTVHFKATTPMTKRVRVSFYVKRKK